MASYIMYNNGTLYCLASLTDSKVLNKIIKNNTLTFLIRISEGSTCGHSIFGRMQSTAKPSPVHGPVSRQENVELN